MKQKIIGLSQRYMAALRTHLKQGPRASLQPALRLGREAVAFGLETLELARIHAHALVTLELAKGKNGLIKRAAAFFAESIIPIEETHRAAKQSKIQLLGLTKALRQRTEELAASDLQLKEGVVRRKGMVDAHEKSDKRHDKSLEESMALQKRLRQLTHKVLAAQEDERNNISHELQDEIAQTLLGINVRLLSLKQSGRSNTKSLKNEIVSAQRLVTKSAQSVRRFARELNRHHATHNDSFVPTH